MVESLKNVFLSVSVKEEEEEYLRTMSSFVTRACYYASMNVGIVLSLETIIKFLRFVFSRFDMML